MDEPVSTRIGRGQLLEQLAREPLDDYAVDELRDRVKALHDEIDRVESQLKKKQSGLAAADSLFKPRP